MVIKQWPGPFKKCDSLDSYARKYRYLFQPLSETELDMGLK